MPRRCWNCEGVGCEECVGGATELRRQIRRLRTVDPGEAELLAIPLEELDITDEQGYAA